MQKIAKWKFTALAKIKLLLQFIMIYFYAIFGNGNNGGEFMKMVTLEMAGFTPHCTIIIVSVFYQAGKIYVINFFIKIFLKVKFIIIFFKNIYKLDHKFCIFLTKKFAVLGGSVAWRFFIWVGQ